ncbi:putative protein OS=Streptomyces cyaneofuscatus OX=66883 GN=G3I52_05385 PE=4 SV=1 [Streptomyces cyaneofuscatus]
MIAWRTNSASGQYVSVTATLVEIHVPLLPTPDLPDGSSPHAWIDQVEDFLVDLEDEGGVEVHDEGEEYGDAYVFFVTGAAEEELLAVASRVATLPGVPAGAFAVVSDDEAEEFGQGRRVALPLPGV